jgi:phage baseplate assembly protein W
MARIRGLAVNFRFDQNGYPSEDQDVALLGDSILVIIKTIPGERPFRPTFGCYVVRLLFANMSTAASMRARTEARRAIETWEPRVIVDDIITTVSPASVTNASAATNQASTIALSIIWRPKGSPDQTQQTSLQVTV